MPCSPFRSATPHSTTSRARRFPLQMIFNCSIFDGNHCSNLDGSGHREDVKTIKRAILESQGRALCLVSGQELSLYFGIGLYISAHSRKGYWGTGAIEVISDQIRKEMPGLRGFSAENMKKMRTFSEFWSRFINRSPVATDLQRASMKSCFTAVKL